MKVGDIVRCSHWMHQGQKGIIVEAQKGDHCIGAYVLLENGELKLIRFENLIMVYESR